MGKIIGIIPARMASIRYPGKPLEKIKGIPMIEHIYNNSKKSKILDDVYVATCDKEIEEYMLSIGGKSVITSKKHERASDRISEALDIIEKEIGVIDIVTMIQGDEPMVTGDMIDKCINYIINNKIEVSNLVSPIKKISTSNDYNEVKVVTDINNNALYYSRESIPSNKKTHKYICKYKQVGVIVFTKHAIKLFSKLKQTPLEKIESVDMLRFIENGYKIKIIPIDKEIFSVDVCSDIKIVEKLI